MLYEDHTTTFEVTTQRNIHEWKQNMSQTSTVSTIIELSLTVPCLILNSIVVFAIFYVRRLHTIPNFLIASLAGSDIIIACVNAVCRIAGLQQRYMGAKILVCLQTFLTMCSLLSSHCSHLFISAERWLYIARPYLHQRIVTRRTCACTVLISWIVSCAASAKTLINCEPRGHTEMVNMGIADPCVHFLLSIAMFSIYAHIAVITRRQIRTIKTLTNVSDPNIFSDKEKILISLRRMWSTVRMLVTVSGTYFLFLTPQVSINIYIYTNRDFQLYSSAMAQCVRVLTLLHSYFIFLIYARQDKDFKYALGKFWAKIGLNCCNRQVSPDKY